MLSGGTIVSFSLRLNILIQAEEVRGVGTYSSEPPTDRSSARKRPSHAHLPPHRDC